MAGTGESREAEFGLGEYGTGHQVDTPSRGSRMACSVARKIREAVERSLREGPPSEDKTRRTFGQVLGPAIALPLRPRAAASLLIRDVASSALTGRDRASPSLTSTT